MPLTIYLISLVTDEETGAKGQSIDSELAFESSSPDSPPRPATAWPALHPPPSEAFWGDMSSANGPAIYSSWPDSGPQGSRGEGIWGAQGLARGTGHLVQPGPLGGGPGSSQVGWGVLSPTPSQPLGFLGAQQEHCLRCAVCLLWGADLWLRPSWWMSTVQHLKKTWLAPGNLLAVW